MSWAKPQFMFCFTIFEPLLHLQYMQIHIEAFVQKLRYIKYHSFATQVTLVTVLGDEQFAFLYKVFFCSNLNCGCFEHEQKPKLVFF